MAKCEKCGTEKVTEKVADYSMKNFEGKIYCFDCQKKLKGDGNKPSYVSGPKPTFNRTDPKIIKWLACLKSTSIYSKDATEHIENAAIVFRSKPPED